MNSKEYFKKEDKSGTLSKEKFVKKDKISAYNDIINYTSKNNLHELRFKEIVYLYINDITEIPKCKNTKCLKKPKFINKTLGYLSFCSNKCQGTSTEIKEKRKNTNIEIYGTEHPIEIIEKRIKSFKNNIDVWKEKYKKTTYTYYKNFYNKYENETFKILETYKSEINNQTIIHAECNLCKNNFNINYPIFFHRYKNNYTVCINCNPLNNNISSFHLDVLNFIKNIYSDEIIINDRNELNGREIDIFLPKMDIGIECNGLYWHSEQFIHKTYHRDKYLDSKKNDIRLFQIWEDDWNYKKIF